ncbi:unnamed protein product, partial [Musa acuminata var. zebrina]
MAREQIFQDLSRQEQLKQMPLWMFCLFVCHHHPHRHHWITWTTGGLSSSTKFRQHHLSHRHQELL